MLITINNFAPYVFVIFVAFLSIFNGICGIRFAEEQYYPGGYYDNQQAQYVKINAALDKLEHAPKLVPDWPDPSVEMGQVSAVALDMAGRVLVFHRGSHTWEVNTFSDRNVYQAIGEKPIPQSTILVFNETGELVDKWGQNLFHMPHGITVDNKGNVWTTDVAMHQVFKFTPDNRQKPAMVLGEKFIPGDDDFHFCKPSAVAVLDDGDFFVADGYCNTRIIKFSPDGRMILQWGKRYGESPFALRVPHALTLAGSQESQVCVADRERGRVACFASSNGTFVASYASWLVGGRLFSVAYAPLNGGRLYVVNGPGGGVRVRGYVIDFTSGRLVQTFAPVDDFHNPHDVVVSPDGSKVYVAELSPFRVYKFVDDSLRNESKTELNFTRVKPTATVEVASEASVNGERERGEGWEWGRGAAGGAAGALGAALLLVAALALRSARNRGRKSVTRRRWEYGHGEFKLRRLLERRRFTRVHSDDSDDEPAPMLPPQPPANA